MFVFTSIIEIAPISIVLRYISSISTINFIILCLLKEFKYNYSKLQIIIHTAKV